MYTEVMKKASARQIAQIASQHAQLRAAIPDGIASDQGTPAAEVFDRLLAKRRTKKSWR